MNKILIVDDEIDVLEINAFCASQTFEFEYDLTFASSGYEAINKLENDFFDLCICDHNMPNGNGAEVCSFISRKMIKTKFVLCSSVLPTELPTIYSNKNIFFNIVKPEIVDGFSLLAKKLQETISTNEESQDNNSSKINDIETTPQYSAVDVKILPWLEVLPCDLYISLTENKFVKYLNKGDAIDADVIKILVQKKLSYLYFCAGIDKKYLLDAVSEKLHSRIISSKFNIENRIKICFENLSQRLIEFGISNYYVDLAFDSIVDSLKIIKKNDKPLNGIRRHDITGDFQTQHYTLQSILICLISKKISWFTSNHLQDLLIASFYQDLTLDSENLMKISNVNITSNKQVPLSPLENECLLNHPLMAKDLVLKLNLVSETVSKLIHEHHELPNGDGFPRKINHTNTRPLSAFFIITGVASREILKKELNTGEEIINYLIENKFNLGVYNEFYNILAQVLNVSK
jgi:CheY-like chemotaxis protein